MDAVKTVPATARTPAVNLPPSAAPSNTPPWKSSQNMKPSNIRKITAVQTSHKGLTFRLVALPF